MPALHEKLRKQLEKTVIEARDIAEEAAREALKRLAVDQPKPFEHMTPDERELRNKLRAKARQLGDRRDNAGKQAIDHLAVECAYEHWHRMLFARFLAENHLLIYEEMGVSVSLDECEELAKEEGTDGWTLAARFASRMLPQIFRPDDPVLAVTLAPESKRALEKMLDTLPPEVFTADDSLGWVYQFWQTKRKDEVNASGNKIGAAELPAVTQLFTEHYMVLFLLHNTLGAWWAGKVLQTRDREGADKEEVSEDEWRKRAALPGYEFNYLRFLPDGTPAAGTFSGWPKQAKDLKILDPCCGSGHFLVAAFDLMVRIRMDGERLSTREACDAVLRDNLFGLEIDQRCTQIAAFALALSAWRFSDAGGYRALPEFHIACSGIGPNASEEQWLNLAEQSGVPMPAIGKQPIREGLRNLHALFSQAPTLGSLIDPGQLPGDLIAADYETLQPYLAAALTAEHADDEARERAVAAAGMVKAAELLTSEYTLVITNVPYLGRGKQDDTLKAHLEKHYDKAKADLATAFVLRCLEFCDKDGTTALVTPQNWAFATTYKNFREECIRQVSFGWIVRLGPRAFETISGEVVNTILVVFTRSTPAENRIFAGIDVAAEDTPASKSLTVRTGSFAYFSQVGQLKNPDSRILLRELHDSALLGCVAHSYQGVKTGDDGRMKRNFWELPVPHANWRFFQSTVGATTEYGGCEYLLAWQDDGQDIARLQGQGAWQRRGVAVSLMNELRAAIYLGDAFDSNVAALVPNNDSDALAVWAYCSSSGFRLDVRAIDSRVNAMSGSLTKVPFELESWRKTAMEEYPNGLPDPKSDDPTQWYFHGHPRMSRNALQVAVGVLLGYRWPPQLCESLPLHAEARECVTRCHELARLVDDDGIVCIPAVRGERMAADRVRAVLSAAYRDAWSPAKQEELLASVGYGGKSIGEWLGDGFFEQHSKLFHHRPFIWHVWDGRKKDGFGALVNYHMLDQKLLDRLIYTYLGDWIKRQEQAVAQGESGADARLLAAQQLQEKLKLIAEGKPPHDIFVRWKPIENQAIGWNPDLNDGVRMNIRPFMEANILRKRPNINWKKDRGKEPQRPQEQYPWFYDENGKPTGDRVNDVHLTVKQKRDARSEAAVSGNP